jgi:hypothetical protein
MRLPRLTTRRLMVLVAVVALPLAIRAGIESRRERLRRWEGDHLNSYLANANSARKTDRSKRLARYHVDLARKYDRAVLRFWLPFPPDPPAPE